MAKILSSIKTMLNIEQSITAFDSELIMHINAAIAELVQGGVGPENGLTITADTDWDAFSTNQNVVSHAQEYINCKTKLIWDPPANSFVCEAYNKRAEESYWRAYLESDELRRDSNNE